MTVPAVAAEMSGTIAGLQRGDSLSAYDLMFGLLLPSGNDAAVALSAHFGHADLRSQDPHGTFSERDNLQHFVSLMNRQAKLIGLQNTHFTNPTGLSDHRNHSTAFEVGLLACECMREPIVANIMARKAYHCETRRSRMGTR